MGGGNGVPVVDLATRKVRFSQPKLYFIRKALDWSPDGNLIVAGDEAGRLFWVRSDDGSVVRRITAHRSPVMGVRWSPDGRRIATVGFSGVMKIWDAATGTELLSFGTDRGVFTGLAWSEDGRRLATVGGNLVRIWGSPEMADVPDVAYLESGVLATAKSVEGKYAGKEASPMPAIEKAPDEFLRELSDPDAPASLLALAEVQLAGGFHQDTLGSLDKADAALKKLEQLDPTRGRELAPLRLLASRIRASTHLVEGRTRDALDSLEKVLGELQRLDSEREEGSPSYPAELFRVRKQLAELYWGEQDYRLAAQFYEHVVEREATEPHWQRLAKALAASGQQERAGPIFERWLKNSYNDAPSLNHRAWFNVIDPNPEFRNGPGAVKLAGRAVELNPDRDAYLNTLGVALYRAGRWREAVTVLNKSMSVNGPRNHAYQLFFLAMAHHQLRESGKAADCYDEAVRLMGEFESVDPPLVQFRKEAEALPSGPTLRNQQEERP